MPTIQKFSSCHVEMRYRDHLPPHVHIVMSDGRQALVELESLRVIADFSRREMQEALEWIRAERRKLLAMWERYH
jgi:hypothetical protein